MSVLDKIKAMLGKTEEPKKSIHGSGRYKAEVEVDYEADEQEVVSLINKRRKFGKGWRQSSNKRSRYDLTREGAKLEVKSRTYGSDFPTWIIDSYKVDYLIETYPEEDLYFVNVFNGDYHIYDLRYVATCEKKKTHSSYRSGHGRDSEFYVIPKKDFIMELKTGKRGKKA